MGTTIELTVAGLGIDWAKNHMGNDHGFLFQEVDRQMRRLDADEIESYAQNPESDPSAEEAAFIRPLIRVLPRLNLLGYTLEAARGEYEELVRQDLEVRERIGGPEETVPDLMSFDEFCSFVCRYPLSSLDDTYIDFETDDRENIAKGRFREFESEIARMPRLGRSSTYWSEQSYFGSFACLLSPYSMLQVFGQCDLNADAEVMWHYGPIVCAGWVDLEAFVPSARRDQTILVATEGSSDSRILRHALNLLRPEIADFFRFIDLEEPHPFWGTGNLVKFAEGLIRIDVQNQVLFVLDNDAEGVDAFNRLCKLSLPENMRAMVLPDLEDFRQFRARGPDGVSIYDINGRAAAIECYLDLRLPDHGEPHALWSNYKKEVGTWHGALEHKETYMRRFLEQTNVTIRQSGYDTAKLQKVLTTLIVEAQQLACGRQHDYIVPYRDE